MVRKSLLVVLFFLLFFLKKKNWKLDVPPQPGELWYYLPWIAAPLMDLIVFGTLLWSHSRIAWIAG